MTLSAENGKQDLLLHLCCAPCSPHPINTLKKNCNLTLYFYNPNIHPEEEYRSRLKEVEKLADIERLPLIVGDYRPDLWIEKMKDLKDEPEKGKRCEICIGGRLMQTARKASELGIKDFGTVLSVSPHKDAVMINNTGKIAEEMQAENGADVRFYKADFKKKDGFKISSSLSKSLGFKRQDYCGCVYSFRN